MNNHGGNNNYNNCMLMLFDKSENVILKSNTVIIRITINIFENKTELFL